jgi:histidinol-phosphate aminotransferase
MLLTAPLLAAAPAASRPPASAVLGPPACATVRPRRRRAPVVAAAAQQPAAGAAGAALRGADFIRPHLRTMAPYTPIVPFDVLSEQLGRAPADIIKLDANENPYGPPPGAFAQRGALLGAERG